MDLSFTRGWTREVTALPTELAVLLVGVASRQAASPTARAQAGFAMALPAGGWDRPASGAFHAATAAALTRWQGE